MSDTTAAEQDISAAQDQVSIGFITAQITSLPIAIRVILTLLCIVIGVALCTVSPYAARWGTQWGIGSSGPSHNEEASVSRKKFRLAGGVLGIFAGAIGATYIILLLSLAVLNTQDDPSLSPWAILVISFIASIAGGILGGRWKVVSRLLLTLTGSISLTLLFSTSFKIDHQLGRLIIFLILFIFFLITSFVFFLISSRTSLQILSYRISFLLTSATGAWLIFGTGLDIFVKCGLFDGMSLLVSSGGVFKDGDPSSDDGNGNGNGNEDGKVSNVVMWDQGRCKGLLAAMWLMIIAGTVFQIWRYSVIGDDLDESWNTYLGSLLSNEKTLITQARSNNNSSSKHTIADRAGFFTSRQGWFKRLFMSNSKQRKRLLPATYMLPEEQADHHSPHGTPGDGVNFERAEYEHDELEARGDMREIRNSGRNAPPAKYDSLGYSTVGLGLYDSSGVHPRDHDYLPDTNGIHDSPEYPDSYAYDGRRISSQVPVPVYSPGIYAHQAQNSGPALQRSDSEPSFNAVPKYALHSASRVEKPSILSGDTMVERTSAEGIYSMRKIVEEPQEEEEAFQRDRRERQAFVAPLPTRARMEEFQMRQTFPSNAREQANPDGREREVGEHVPVPATPSLVNAIRRVSEAQAQARAWRVKEQQAALSPSYKSESDLANSSSPMEVRPARGMSPSIPDSERIALKQAAIRRQASAEWWNEVEKRANEQAQKERSTNGSRNEVTRMGSGSFSPRVSSAPDERSMPWRSNSRGPSRYQA